MRMPGCGPPQAARRRRPAGRGCCHGPARMLRAGARRPAPSWAVLARRRSPPPARRDRRRAHGGSLGRACSRLGDGDGGARGAGRGEKGLDPAAASRLAGPWRRLAVRGQIPPTRSQPMGDRRGRPCTVPALAPPRRPGCRPGKGGGGGENDLTSHARPAASRPLRLLYGAGSAPRDGLKYRPFGARPWQVQQTGGRFGSL